MEEGPFIDNSARNCSYYFGRKALQVVLQANKLQAVIRAHEAQLEGFRLHNWTDSSLPPLLTLFSAPNYCDFYENKAAIIYLQVASSNKNGVISVHQYGHSPHPFVLPNFCDVIAWSLPFVSEKVLEVMHSLLSPVDEQEEEPTDEKEDYELDQQIEKILAHIKIDKMSETKVDTNLEYLQSLLNSQSEKRARNEVLINNAKKKPFAASKGSVLDIFASAKENDFENEQMPSEIASHKTTQVGTMGSIK